MDALNALGCAWLALAHTPRADATHTFGSQMFDAAADVTVQLLTDDSSREGVLGLGLKLAKRNDIPPQKEPLQIALEFDEMGLVAVRNGAAFEFPEIEANRKPKASEAVKRYMEEHGRGDASAIAEETGFDRGTIVPILHGDQYVSLGKEGRRAMFALRDSRHEVWETQLPTVEPQQIHRNHNTTPVVGSDPYGNPLSTPDEESPF